MQSDFVNGYNCRARKEDNTVRPASERQNHHPGGIGHTLSYRISPPRHAMAVHSVRVSFSVVLTGSS
jgi:hypothetical protein